MHSQDAKTKNKKHILEIDYFKSNTAKYLEDVVYKVKTILSSPESALFLSDIYDSEFKLTIPGSPVDDMLGPVLYRESEDVTSYNGYGGLVDTYIKFDIQKFFGMSLPEFTDLTKDKIDLLVNKAEAEILRITEHLAEIGEELQDEHKSLSGDYKHEYKQ